MGKGWQTGLPYHLFLYDTKVVLKIFSGWGEEDQNSLWDMKKIETEFVSSFSGTLPCPFVYFWADTGRAEEWQALGPANPKIAMWPSLHGEGLLAPVLITNGMWDSLWAEDKASVFSYCIWKDWVSEREHESASTWQAWSSYRLLLRFPLQMQEKSILALSVFLIVADKIE